MKKQQANKSQQQTKETITQNIEIKKLDNYVAIFLESFCCLHLIGYQTGEERRPRIE